MASVTANTVEHGVTTSGTRFVSLEGGALSDDYVVGVSETLDLSNYIGVIDSVQITDNSLDTTVKLDTANCDYANSTVALLAVDLANAAGWAANTDLSGVGFDLLVFGKMRKG